MSSGAQPRFEGKNDMGLQDAATLKGQCDGMQCGSMGSKKKLNSLMKATPLLSALWFASMRSTSTLASWQAGMRKGEM